MNGLVKFIAIVLAVAASAISVVGLGAIFSGSYWEVVVVASILEASKVSTAAWLHINWGRISLALKSYLSVAVVALMAITSLGIYGFFARAHIEQQVQIATGEASRIPLIDTRIAAEKKKILDLETQIRNLDSSLNAMVEKSKRSRDAEKALRLAKNSNRTDLVAQRDSAQDRILTLETEKSKLQNVVAKHEVEVGPIKYLTNMFLGGVATKEQLEKSVQFLILAIVLVFDPLAIAMLIASAGLKPVVEQVQMPVPAPAPVQTVSPPKKRKASRKKSTPKKKKTVIELDSNDQMKVRAMVDRYKQPGAKVARRYPFVSK